MAIPTTIEQTEYELNLAIKNYYKILESGTEEEVSAALTSVSNLQSLKTAFLSGNPSVLIKQMAVSAFDNAINSYSSDNINEAFEAFNSYTSYVNNNSIGFDTNTNLPIFPSGDTLVVYNDAGEDHIISATGD